MEKTKLRVIEGGRNVKHRYTWEEIYVGCAIAVIWGVFILFLAYSGGGTP